MKRFFTLLCAVVAFAACEQVFIDVANDVAESDRSLSVSFEGDETRVQLNEAQKTVWTEGDHVSVFYRSTVNEEWQFMGETGDRIGQIVPVDNSVNPPATHNHVVVVYPYNEDYFYNTETYNIEASMPAVQHYLKDSYGTNGTLMVSSSEFNKVSLKSVCGWLKLQLTGDGEVVKSITLRGNDGEQVAGELYINTSDATCVLASASGDAGESEVGGTLVRPGTILTEVTLDCGEGVALGKNATAFYIALPPQTFEKGFTVEIECDGYKPMTLSTTNTLTIERNHIQPMAGVEHNAIPVVPNNQIWYTSSNGKVVTPYKTNVFGATIISNEYNNGMGVITFDSDVTTIGNQAFAGCDSLISVNIPDSVTSIGSSAFGWCTSLTSVTIPDSVTSIGDSAFRSCESLTSVTIGDSVTTIGNAAFEYCISLTSVTIPDSVTSIGEGAFYNCYCLTSVTIGDSVTTIGDSAFWDCTSLTEFKGKFAEDNGRILVVDGVLKAFAPAGITEYNIPDSVTTIGIYAFASCDSLTCVTIPDSVTTIGDAAFQECISLTSMNIGDSVTTIGNCAFLHCFKLTSVNIPDSVTSIGGQAFLHCFSLTSVNIPDSVTTIGVEAFIYCNNLKEFKGKYATEDGRSLIVDNTIIAYANASGTTYTIPDSVTTIGEYAFRSCSSLTSVNIPDSVTTIGYYAFYGCTSLKSVYCKATTPPSLGGIYGNYVFDYNGSGRKIYVPAGSVETYKSATRWSEYADAIVGYDFEKDEIVEVQPNNEIWYTSSDGDVVKPNNTNDFGAKIISNTYNNGKGVIIFDGDVTTIGEYAFYGCKSLTSVNIPDSVTTIGNYAFNSCTSLTSVNIPDSVTTIGSGVLGWCTSLTSVTIGDSVTTIGNDAFAGCYSLTSVNIPDSVTTIGYEAFNSCASLTSVYCKATTPPALGGASVFDYNGWGRKIYVPAGSVEAYKSAEGWSEYASAIVGYNF